MKKFSLVVLFLLTAIFIMGSIFLFSGEKLKNTEKKSVVVNNEAISTVIVPHHDLVKAQRADFFKSIQGKTNPDTIILVSPNHFDNGNSSFIVPDKQWNEERKIKLADDAIADLALSGVVGRDDSVFVREHGINNIMPDIELNFPNSKIIPIAIKQNANEESVNSLFDNLNKICTKNCLLIASIDFSHYQPGAISELHDQYTLRALNNLDELAAWKSEVDSNQALLLAVKWAKAHDTLSFNLFLNTNSGKLANDRDAEGTSYVLGDFESGKEKKISDQVTFLIGGDVMLDRAIDFNYRDNKIFDLTSQLGSRLFQGTDLSMVNLEGPISDQSIPPDETIDNLIFNFPPTTPALLNRLNINAVSLANNHTDNNGSSGLANTKKVLEQAGIKAIGQESFVNQNSVTDFGDGKKLSVITAFVPDENDRGVSDLIKKSKAEGKFVLVFPHWGVEYQPTHSSVQEKMAHAWIDSGADIVIGSHPHVIQDAEVYKNRPIFYSLGNLIFDQTFSKETEEGLLIGGLINDDNIELSILPVISKNYKPELLTGSEKTAILDRFHKMLNQTITSNSDYGYDKIILTY